MQSAWRLNGTRTGTAIVDHGNPGAWHGTLTTVTVTCRVSESRGCFRWPIGALESREFLFGLLANALGRALRDTLLPGMAHAKVAGPHGTGSKHSCHSPEDDARACRRTQIKDLQRYVLSFFVLVQLS